MNMPTRPACFEFAMNFLGDPEEAELRNYIEALEICAGLAEPDPVGPMDEPLGDLIDVWVQEAFNKKPYGCSHPTHAHVACKAFEYGKNDATHPAISVSELLEPEWVRQEDQTHKTTDHAQLIDGEWWAPYSDLFSMQRILDNARAHAQRETEGGVA